VGKDILCYRNSEAMKDYRLNAAAYSGV